MSGKIAFNGRDGLDMDRRKYMSKHDIVYESPSYYGFDGMPLGNGNMGAMVTTSQNSLNFVINRNDAWDDSPTGICYGETDFEQNSILRHCGECVIETGYPVLDLMYLKNFEERLSLHDAELDLKAETPFSKISSEMFVSEKYSVLAINYRDSLEEAVPRKVTLRRWGSRSYIYWYHKVDRSPELGLSGTETAIEDKDFACVSQHLRSRDIVLMATISGTDFRIEKLNSHEIQFHLPPGKNSEFTVFITCLTTEDSANPVADCRKILSDARNAGFRRIREEHREDWSSFWGKSFIQLYDDYVENLWYLNLYHIGSSSKGKYPPRFINYSLWNWNKDIMPWFIHHWNEQTYFWLLHTAGHAELAETYLNWRFKALDNARDAAKMLKCDGVFYTELTDATGKQMCLGSCEQSVWYTVTAQIALQFYEHFNYKYDVKFLKEKCFPVLEGAVRLYLSVFKEGDDSLYHIAKSMGYETSFFTSDTSVDLVHGRELFNAYIDSANYMEVNKEILGKCRRVLNKLSALPTCIYKNREVAAVGHDLETGKPVHIGWTNPHKMKWVFGGSDISQAFPCSQTGLDQKGDRFFKITRNTLLIQKVNPENGGILPNMIALARMGLSDQLAEYMDTWVNAFQQFPNGFMYYSPIVWSKELDKKLVKFKVGRQDSYSGVEREAGFKDIRAFNLVRVVEDGKLTGEVVRMPKQPFAHFGFEPPSILATAVNEMLLQSHQWGIRVFPAYPENKDGRFELMARRGFRVVSEKTGGEIKYVFIESLQGLECRIINPWGGKMEIAIKDLSSATASDFVKDGDRITFKTVRGGKYLIFRKNAPVEGMEKTVLTAEPNKHVKMKERASLGMSKSF